MARSCVPCSDFALVVSALDRLVHLERASWLPRIEDIAKEIVELPRHQRLTLVRLLLDLDQPGNNNEVDAAWDEEIRARVKAIDDGRAVGIPYEQIRKKMTIRPPAHR